MPGVVGIQALLHSIPAVILSCSLGSKVRWHLLSGWYRLSPISTLSTCQSKGWVTTLLFFLLLGCVLNVEVITIEYKVGTPFLTLEFSHLREAMFLELWMYCGDSCLQPSCPKSLSIISDLDPIVSFGLCFIGIWVMRVWSWSSFQNFGPHPKLWIQLFSFISDNGILFSYFLSHFLFFIYSWHVILY